MEIIEGMQVRAKVHSDQPWAECREEGNLIVGVDVFLETGEPGEEGLAYSDGDECYVLGQPCPRLIEIFNPLSGNRSKSDGKNLVRFLIPAEQFHADFVAA